MATLSIKFNQTPQQTLDYIKAKKLKTTYDYKELQKEAHHKSFTVAKIMKLDLLSDIQSSLLKAMKEGKGFKKWKKELKPTLQKKGWWGEKEILNTTTGEVAKIYVGSNRLKTIFETNARAAHSTGRANNIYQSSNEYLRYNATMDSVTRPTHSSMNGMIKHKLDGFWDKNFPSNGWGCRCWVTSHSKKEIEKKGWKVDTRKHKLLADKDFAYDTRYLSKETLESTYYKKAQDYAKNCIENNAKGVECKASKSIVKNAVEYVYSINRQKSYESFVDEVIKDKKYYKNIVAAGAIDYNVHTFLKQKNITPSTPHIYLSKHSLLHMIRESKKQRGSSLSIMEIKNIPQALKDPFMILYDTKHKNILYILDSNKGNKTIIEVNYKYKKESVNMIITSGKVDMETLQGEIKGSVYQVIKE